MSHPDHTPSQNSETLYVSHHSGPQVWRRRKLGHAFDAADLAQETFRACCATLRPRPFTNLPGTSSALTLGGGVNWQHATTTRGMALVNLMSRHEVSGNLSLALPLNNALDRRHCTGIGSNFGAYAAPRNVMLSAKYTYRG